MNTRTYTIVVLAILTQSIQAMSESYLTFLGVDSSLGINSRSNRSNQVDITPRDRTIQRLVLELIAKNPDLSYLTEDSPLLELVRQEKYTDAVALMLKHKANPNVHDAMFGTTPLHHAIQCNNVQAIKLLLHAGAAIDSKDTIEGTPLHHSLTEDRSLHKNLQKNRVALVKLLLQHKANPLEYNKYKDTTLNIAHKEYERALKVASKFESNPHVSHIASHYKVEAEDYKKIARLLIAHMGLYSKQGRIAREGLAQVLPIEIARHIASYLPEYAITTNTDTQNQPCPICFEHDTEPKAQLACGHNDFHITCLEQWREMGTTTAHKCPLCRQQL